MKILIISEISNTPSTVGEHVITNTSHKLGLLTFLTEVPDIIFCYAEIGNIRGKYEEHYQLLCDIRTSLLSNQKLFRVGFTTGGPDQLLRLPFSPDEFLACLQ